MNEIKWNIINSVLAGGLVFLGAIADGNITFQGFCAAVIAGLLVALIKFKDFWGKKMPLPLFQFVH